MNRIGAIRLLTAFLLCISATIFLPVRVLSQGMPLLTDPVWHSGPANNSYAAALGDIDLDGDLDLVCVNYDLRNTVYLNVNGTFESIPSWRSTPSNRTTSLALGDVDGDGDLDLVCGNYGQRNTLYINNGGAFYTDPAWLSDETNNTYDVSLGDMDTDGDLDLVCANFSQTNTIYFNESGSLATLPGWRTAAAFKTTCLAIGDVDNDGDIDLACGNFDEANTLYLSNADTLSWNPVWSSDSTMSTWTLSLGDVNGDGLLDLLCGNTGDFTSAQSNTLYLGQGSAFSNSPDWISAPEKSTNATALADMDGDGDLDAVFGNVDQSNDIHINTAGVLSSDPVWLSVEENRTYGVIPGDIDGDGDLDLACANSGDWPSGEPNTLYLNIRDYIKSSAGWTSSPTNSTRSVALADVDSDGDLDLACGNSGQGNTLYLNENSGLAITPVWTSNEPNATWSVAFGDVDGNGFPDLVCGNLDQGNTLYLNDAGSLSLTPDWRSTPANATWSVALADMDADGDLDLVCGNLDQSNTIYLNNGGSFPLAPDWSSNATNSTWSITLGDIDGNGFPEIICGNGGFGGQSNTAYFNDSGNVDTIPSWFSDPANATWSVTLGDVDGDGDLDLACGNPDEHNTIYINSNGVLSTSPGWSSVQTNATRSVSFADIDCDGDLDLVCGNYNQAATLYLNNRGSLETNPVWSAGPAQPAGALVPADIDRDGDLDLVCGNFDSGNTVLDGWRNPLFMGDFSAPLNQNPNTDPILRNATASYPSGNIIRIDLMALDVESDNVRMLLEYQYEGEWTWYPLENVGTEGLTIPLQTSPGGIPHSFDWDISRMPFDGRDAVARIRSIENPGGLSVIRSIQSYQMEIGPVTPLRPEITSSTGLISFATVTVGDTVTQDLALYNTGNAELTITDIALPSTEMRLSSEPPYTLQKQESLPLTIFLEPINATDATGDLGIYSNDPLTPVELIVVESDIRALEISSRLLKPVWDDEVKLGEALTVLITPAPQVNVEGGALHYTIPGKGWFQSPLSPSEGEFFAIIPGTDVTEAGLSYYVEVFNLPVYNTDPPGAPDDSLFAVEAQPPDTVTASPQPNSGDGYLEGREIRVLAILQDGAVFESGRLYYRKGGATTYDSVDCVIEGTIPYATVPDSAVGPRGLEYWLEVNTLTSSLTDPEIVPAMRPHPLVVTIQNLEEPRIHRGARYRMISVPLQFSDDFTGTLEALLSDQKEFGPYDPVKWRSFRYVPDSLRYAELSNNWAADVFRPEPGKAFWLIASLPNRVNTSPVTGYSTRTDSLYTVLLSPGWNQIGSPFDFPVAWDSMLVDSMLMAQAETTVIEPPARWSGGGYRYDTEILEPFEGYWVNNTAGSVLTLRLPPDEALYEAPPVEAPLTAMAEDPDMHSWTIAIHASCAESADRANVIGVSRDASNGWDWRDRAEAPTAPGEALSLYFPHGSWGEKNGPFTTDIRGGYENLSIEAILPDESTDLIAVFHAGQTGSLGGHLWRFDVAKSFSRGAAGDEVLLEFDRHETLPPHVMACLVDKSLGKIVDLRAENIYSFFSGKRAPVSEEETRFLLLVGSEEFIESHEEDLPELPRATTLMQNYPNPFNPSTIIRYAIDRRYDIALRIYDARGALVKTLVRGRRDAGVYEEGWDGRNDEGRAAASGVYFYRLETSAGFRQTRKLVLLR